MRPSFHPRLVNDPYSDPGLFVPFRFQKRALQFDLGDLGALSTRDLLKITHAFVTHAHMDHFVGFDALLRIQLGREKVLHLYGPEGFLAHLEGKLSGYSWNLVDEFENKLLLKASEVRGGQVLTTSYASSERFSPLGETSSLPFSGILHEEPSFSVSGVLLDHKIPCLGLSVRERFCVNIIKEGLGELGLPAGPWLNRFKAAIYEGCDPESEFRVRWKTGEGRLSERRVRLGALREGIARISPGRKITYIADVIATPENCEKIVGLALGSDILFIEAAFLESERDQAEKKYHLTARQAGILAARAGAPRFRLFHFSPRYRGRAGELEREAREAYASERRKRGGPPSPPPNSHIAPMSLEITMR